MTTVINIKDAPAGWKTNPAYVYIGRGSQWGNPFPIPKYTREECLELFLEHAKQTFTKTQVAQLVGKILVCYCKPLECHGDYLAAWADRYSGKYDLLPKL